MENVFVITDFFLKSNNVLVRIHESGFCLVCLLVKFEVIVELNDNKVAISVLASDKNPLKFTSYSGWFFHTDVFVRFERKHSKLEMLFLKPKTGEISDLIIVKRLILHCLSIRVISKVQKILNFYFYKH